MGPSYHMPFCDCNAARLAPELLVPMGPSPYLRFCVQKSDFWSRITSLYGTQTTPVVLCMQDSVISTWITSLYGSLPSSVVIACKTANIGPKYNSLWVPDLTCRFVHAKRHDLHQKDKITWVPILICGFVRDFKTKTATLGLELHVSMGPRRHLLFSVR